jgi:hypothetical protein
VEPVPVEQSNVTHLNISDLAANSGQPDASVVAPVVSSTDVPSQGDDLDPIAVQPVKEDVSTSKDVVLVTVMTGTGAKEEVAEGPIMVMEEEDVKEEEEEKEEKPQPMTNEELAAVMAKNYPYWDDALIKVIKNAMDESHTGRQFYCGVGPSTPLEGGTMMHDNGVLLLKGNGTVGPGVSVLIHGRSHVVIGALEADTGQKKHWSMLTVLKDVFWSQDLDTFEVDSSVGRQTFHHGNAIPKGDFVVSSLAGRAGFLERADKWRQLCSESKTIVPSSPVVGGGGYHLRKREPEKTDISIAQKRVATADNHKEEEKLKKQVKKLKADSQDKDKRLEESENARRAAEDQLEEAHTSHNHVTPHTPADGGNNHPVNPTVPPGMVPVAQAELIARLLVAQTENEQLRTELREQKTDELLKKFLPPK